MLKTGFYTLLTILTLSVSINTYANSIAAEAVLGKIVVLKINGVRQQFRVGETHRGVKVISASNAYVTVLSDQQKRRLKVGAASITTNYSPSIKSESIRRNRDGMYVTTGAINKGAATFLVDTGASAVAMSPHHAKSLGIDYKRDGRRTQTSTANGVAPGYLITLASVSVGSIKQNNVEAVVIEGAGLSTILLGMSFLNRVEVANKNGVMTLTSP